MLVVMERNATDAQIRAVVEAIENLGLEARAIVGTQRTAVGIVGNDGRVDPARLTSLSGVREVVQVTRPYREVSREWQPEDTIVRLHNGVTIGGNEICLIAGPCAVESESQIVDLAHELREHGATLLRGGAFKPRTSPYSFQGLGLKGLTYLRRAREETGLLVVTEALDPESVEAVEEHADIIQVGSRSMQNYSLLRRLATCSKPVLLKRGNAATLAEWLQSAEYIVSGGNRDVVLCERGIRGFDPQTRNLLDLAAVPAVKTLSHLPVIVDPSHATGARDLVVPMARAAVASGADGVMVEVHPRPERALSDGAQSLYPSQFAALVEQLDQIASVLGRRLGRIVPAVSQS